jgi:hypothetical protein
MRDFEDIKIEFVSQAPGNNPRLDFVISREAEDSWIECFKVAYTLYLTKEWPFGKEGIFIDPKLGLASQPINPPEWADTKRQFSIEWPKLVVDGQKQEIIDFMKKCVSEANDTYRSTRTNAGKT